MEDKMNETFMDQRYFIVCCLILSVFRIYLEVVGFDFSKLPMTGKLPQGSQLTFHKFGLYMSIGYFVLFAPEYLLA